MAALPLARTELLPEDPEAGGLTLEEGAHLLLRAAVGERDGGAVGLQLHRERGVVQGHHHLARESSCAFGDGEELGKVTIHAPSLARRVSEVALPPAPGWR